jgi:hypothetical protein
MRGMKMKRSRGWVWNGVDLGSWGWLFDFRQQRLIGIAWRFPRCNGWWEKKGVLVVWLFLIF